MAPFVVHGIPGSPYGRAVLACLAEKGAPVSYRALAPGAQRAPAHLGRHPFARIPVLEHGEFSLYETQAILRYLDRVLPEPALTPRDPRAAARMDQVMNICDWYLFQGVANVIVFQRVVGPRLLGLPTDERAIAEAMPRARTVFAELSRLLGTQPYFAGDALTLAELMIVPQFELFALTPEWQALTADAGNLRELAARVESRESFRATTWERVAALATAEAADAVA
jgi:glutathione S-transferase